MQIRRHRYGRAGPPPGAPAQPTQAALTKLFSAAWKLAPPNRRPEETCGLPRVVVDVLLLDDAEIAALNVAHLKQRGPTDVLAFRWAK